MKTVYLIGDSIRFGIGLPDRRARGYGYFVKKTLEERGLAEVFQPNENCLFSAYVLENAAQWFEQAGDTAQICVVHWNCGAHDLTRIDGEPLTDVRTYAETLKRIYRRIALLCPNARQVFALNTAIDDDLPGPPRKDADMQRYNDAAMDALGGFPIVLNDLHTLTKAFPRDYRLDSTHFSEEGAQAIAQATAGLIARLI